MKSLVTRISGAALALVLTLSLAAALPATAQEVDRDAVQQASAPPAFAYGLRLGLVETEFYGDVVGSSDRGATLMGGAFLTYRLSPRLALQPEVLVTRRRGEVDHTRVFTRARGADYSLDFAEVPLLAKTYVATRPGQTVYLTFGPYAGMRLNGDAKDMNFVLQDVDINDEVRRWNYGITTGLGLESHAGGRLMSVDVRYNWGLANLLVEHDDTDFRIRGLTFSAGFGL